MNNIELKVKVDDHTAIRSVFKHDRLFKKEGVLIQTDTYFKTQHGRMKLREINREHYQLIYYERPDVCESKLSNYEFVPLTREQYDAFRALFERTMGIYTIVQKKRDLWKYNHTRIHIDKVDKLGNYLELETVMDDTFNFEEAQNEHNKVVNLLGLALYTKCPGSYSDLLLANG